MISVRIDFLPDRNTVIHESTIRDTILKVFSTDHHFDWSLIKPMGSSKLHDGLAGTWRTYYAVSESGLNKSLPQILISILESEDELIKALLKGEYFLEVTFADADFNRITYIGTSIYSVGMIVGLKAAHYQLTKKGFAVQLLDNDSKLLIGDIAVYNDLLGL